MPKLVELADLAVPVANQRQMLADKGDAELREQLDIGHRRARFQHVGSQFESCAFFLLSASWPEAFRLLVLYPVGVWPTRLVEEAGETGGILEAELQGHLRHGPI